jgi:Tfp pilus assembly protein PilO
MSEGSTTLDALKNRTVIICIAVGLLVVVIWLVAFFLPQGSKLSKLNAKEQTLQTQVTAGNAKVAALKKQALNTPALQAMQKQLSTAVPATADIFNYITALQNTATAAGVTVSNLSPSQPELTTGESFATIAVGMSITGTYDETLAFIKGLYALPRLTSINSIDFAGGGPGTSRSTPLNTSFSLTAYTSAKPATPAG